MRKLGFMECTILVVLPCCLWKLVWICMSIWICCWKLVSGYVYMDMLDFVELCCWIWWNMLLDMLLDMYACISVFETMSNYLDLNKNRGYIASLPSASGRQRGHVAVTCANWEHWLPIWSFCRLLADDKVTSYAVSQQTAKIHTSLPSAGGRHSCTCGSFPVLPSWALCRPLADGKERR